MEIATIGSGLLGFVLFYGMCSTNTVGKYRAQDNRWYAERIVWSLLFGLSIILILN